MGSCTSRSPMPAPASGSSGGRVATAKVVALDGSMAQYPAAVTARDALGDDGASVFLCSSDELRFDAPPRALADEEALQPGWLYFVLPVSTLRLALSRHEMTALAVRASSALAVASGVASPPRHKTGTRRMSGANNGKQRKTARVAPLAVAADEDAELAYGSDEKVGKLARKGAGSYRSRGGARHRRRAVGVERLSAILEADEF
uniref:Uncharacterized protein n=1 Tax=Avena sativa TaxID=4498 RepID=A0ACD5XTL4_AVESA